MTAPAQVEGIVAGRWTIDPVHSDISFVVRHLVSKVRGTFETFSGEIIISDDLAKSSATATVDLTSISTKNAQRDAHLRSADFFEADKHPTMTFASTQVRESDDGYVVDGDLTIKDVTKSVSLAVELNGFSADPYGGTRVGFSATTRIKRQDFNVNFNGVVEGVGVLVGDYIDVHIEIEAVLADGQ